MRDIELGRTGTVMFTDPRPDVPVLEVLNISEFA
jgi:hypothetical protein